ncbi:MAG: site-2 protease family protein [Hadesarchaea archaeon]|nr:site-2 protease family protein [Hadesarchaea archaeon]
MARIGGRRLEHPVAKYRCERCGYDEYRMSAREVGEIALGECPRCGGDFQVVECGKKPKELAEVEEAIGKRFEILDFSFRRGRGDFLVETRDPSRAFLKTFRAVKKRGFLIAMREREGELHLLTTKAPPVEKSNIATNIVLLLATIGTTLFAGFYLSSHNLVIQGAWGHFSNAILFSLALMAILGAHEMGHKIAAWRHDVATTWPYFIPFPHPYIGTFGAVIKVKSPIPTKEALVEMGACGPILGFLLALPITTMGIALSEPLGGELFKVLPTPLIFALLGIFKFGHFPSALNPHPFAWAGFIGLLVTWLNLIPAGQLDGGHVVRGVLSKEQHHRLTRTLGFTFIVLGLLTGILPLTMWGLLILLLFGTPHGGALDDVSKLRGRQKIIVGVALAIFILCLPIPL